MRLTREARIPVLTDAIRDELIKRTIAMYRENTLWLSQRAMAVLLSADDVPVLQISQRIHLSRNQVTTWRKRFMEYLPFLKEVEKSEPWLLPDYIELALSDEERDGRPCSYTIDQYSMILKIACNDPRDYGLELSHWSLPALRRTIIKEGIVDAISIPTLCRFLRRVEVHPNRNRYWLHSTEKDEDPIGYKLKIQEINGLYFTAQIIAQMGGEADLRILSTDEMTAIQSLEHKHARKLAKPGMDPKQEFEYIRHGTTSFIGFLDVVKGEVCKPYLNKTRNEYDFVNALGEVIDSDPDPSRRWVIICDNLNTHSSESLVQYIAKEIGYMGDLGEKGKSGILKNQESRIAFLSDRSHRIRMVYTPKHSSWLNQIEIFFGHMNQRLLKKSSYMTLEDLKESIKRYIEQHNLFAHPYRWLYDTTPLGDYGIWYVPANKPSSVDYKKVTEEHLKKAKPSDKDSKREHMKSFRKAVC